MFFRKDNVYFFIITDDMDVFIRMFMPTFKILKNSLIVTFRQKLYTYL